MINMRGWVQSGRGLWWGRSSRARIVVVVGVCKMHTFRREGRSMLQEDSGRDSARLAIGADAQMPGVYGLVCFSGDGYWDSFCYGEISATRVDGGLRGGVGAVCLAAVEGLAGCRISR